MCKTITTLTLVLYSFYSLSAQNLLIWSQPKDYQLTDTGEYLAESNELTAEVQIITQGKVQNNMFTIWIDDKKFENKSGITSLRSNYFRSTIPLKHGLQRITISFKNKEGEVRSKELPVRFSGKPNLWLLSFGTNPPDLQYTDDDARDFAALFKTQEGKLYGKVNVNQYIGEDATSSNMRRGVERLATLYGQQEIRERDVVMLFISSHGFTKDSVLYLRGSDHDPMAPVGTSLDYRFVMAQLNTMECKKIVFIDACYSGSGKKGFIDNNEAIKKLSEVQNGLVTYTSSSSNEPSHEDKTWENGAFTEALLNGLNGAADFDNDKYISVTELWKYIEKEVPRMVRKVKGEKQTPQLTRKELNDIPLFSLLNMDQEEIQDQQVEHDNSGTKITVNEPSTPVTHDNKPTSPELPNEELPSDGLLFITGGTIMMGSNNEEENRSTDETLHQVTVSDFFIGKYEVTQKLWERIMGFNPSTFYNCSQCPVETISWYEVQAFLKKLNEKYPGYNYRLPTEAEWEYAARSGENKEIFSGTSSHNELAKYANACDQTCDNEWKDALFLDNHPNTSPVGKFLPNKFGLHDMSGNVWEWCQDYYAEYTQQAEINPSGPERGTDKVFRGGSWNDRPQDCRVAMRNNDLPTNRYAHIGFRLARSKN